MTLAELLTGHPDIARRTAQRLIAKLIESGKGKISLGMKAEPDAILVLAPKCPTSRPRRICSHRPC